jgi:iron complex outermembrane recepter protein
LILVLLSSSAFTQTYSISFEDETGIIDLNSLEERFEVHKMDGSMADLKTECNINNISIKLDKADFDITFLITGKFKIILRGYDLEKEITIEDGDIGRSILIPIKLSTILSAVEAFDVVTQEQIRYSGRTALTDILHYFIPGFYGLPQTIADGTDHSVPVAFRGLSPDQLLVLVNGKRWHNSALLNINGTVGRGTVGKDLNSIPVIAIEKIEFFKAGAATLFGSDAIAGVVNIVLKETTGVMIDYKFGSTYIGDGNESRLSLMNGIRLKNDGSINFSSEYVNLGAVNRSGAYTGVIFDSIRDGSSSETSRFFRYLRDEYNLDGSRIMKVGRAETQDASFLTNGNINITDSTSVYFFGGVHFRKGYSSGFYRLPVTTSTQVVTALYPLGFLPEIQTSQSNTYFTVGSKKSMGKLSVDMSNSYGQNAIGFTVNNSNNFSLDTLSPNYFNAGKVFYQQNISKIDISGKILGKDNFNVRLRSGAELRYENYKINQGDESSYIGSGSEVFPGFQPDQEVNEWRSNFGAFTNAELKGKIKEFSVRATGGGRYEKYSDFEEQWIGRAATKLSYKLDQNLNLSVRGSWNQGFRAPSLQQRFFSNRSIQSRRNVFTFSNLSPEARLLGILPLEPEQSTNINLGGEILYYNNKNKTSFSASIDYYRILIKNRIVLSGRFNADNLNQDSTLLNRRNQFKALLTSNQYEEAQGFINGIETVTKGLDICSNFKKEFDNGNELNLVFRGNFFSENGQQNVKKQESTTSGNNNIASISPQYLPDLFIGRDSILFNREEIIRYEDAQPQWRTTFLVGSKFKIKGNKALRFDLAWNAFGSVATDQDGPDEIYQSFSPRYAVMDFSASYLFRVKNRDFTISGGANNIAHIKPDKNNDANMNNGRFVYSRRAQQFGMLGGMWFLRLSATL